ncbi:RNA chaperone Hfq [Selenomonas sp. AB3002]|uniref:RNA chaperone Hfq n=1 Tax=Selenomonas sp. AB3002 TaxID=1392502 RepID=UPI000498317A
MVKKNNTDLQDTFLNNVRKNNIQVTIHLVNGFQIKGMVKGFDNFVIMMDVMGRQQMVYKHAVSTVSPARPVNTFRPEEDGEGETAREAE